MDASSKMTEEQKLLYLLSKKIEEKRKQEAVKLNNGLIKAIQDKTIDLGNIEDLLKSIASLIKVSSGDSANGIVKYLVALTDVIESKEFSPEINITTPDIKIPEIKVDVPDPKVVKVETERVVEKEKLQDSIEVSNLKKEIDRLIAEIKKKELGLDSLRGKRGRANAIPVNVVDSVVGGGGLIPYQTSSEKTQKALVDSDGHQQVDVLTLPDISLSGDVEIGAVEIKDHDSETRANVGANGLEVDVKASALPTGAATNSKLDTVLTALGTLLTELQQKTEPGDTQAVQEQNPLDISGLATSANQDPLAKYKIADKDDDAEPNYYGFTNVDGNWYILKENSSTYRYASGTEDYETNWTGRAALEYDYLYNVTV